MNYISYARSGGRSRPRDREHLDILPDGQFTLWRSVGWATNPSTPVGRFEGQLDATQLSELQHRAQAAAQAGHLALPLLPDAVSENIVLGEVRAQLSIHDKPAGPWGVVAAELRALLVELTRFPAAAIMLELSPDGRQARLLHQGNRSLNLKLDGLAVRAELWRDYLCEGEWLMKPTDDAAAKVTAEPGWSAVLPLAHGFALTAGCELIIYVNFEVFDGDWPISVSLKASV